MFFTFVWSFQANFFPLSLKKILNEIILLHICLNPKNFPPNLA